MTDGFPIEIDGLSDHSVNGVFGLLAWDVEKTIDANPDGVDGAERFGP